MRSGSADDMQRVDAHAFEMIHSYTVALAAMKNVSVILAESRMIACTIMSGLGASETLHLAEARQVEISADIHWQINNCLDGSRACQIVLAFAAEAGLFGIPDEELGAMIDAVIEAVKGDNPVGGPTYHWPDAKALEHMLKMRVAASPAPPATNDLLALILTPAIAMPIAATPPAKELS